MATERRSLRRRSVRREPLITLLTDFGTRDYYVGAMKGVILRYLPHARLVDISHGIPPQNIASAAFVLDLASREFPPDTVHVAVVDPGVGTARAILAARARGSIFVAPDNGLLDPVLDENAVARRVTHPRLRPAPASHTFHGRDLFAPIAARLAGGFPFGSVGPRVSRTVPLPWPSLRRQPDALSGHIVHVDRFGNLISDIAGELVTPMGSDVDIEFGSGRHLRGLKQTYADVAPGRPLALIGSAGRLEIAIREGNAATTWNLSQGDPVTIRRPAPSSPST